MVNLKAKPFYLSDEDIKWVNDTISSMTDEEKVGQLFFQLTSSPQEEYIKELHKEKSDLHDKLDKANSRAAVNKILKCQEVGCAQRRPPLGEGALDTFKQIRSGNLGDE